MGFEFDQSVGLIVGGGNIVGDFLFWNFLHGESPLLFLLLLYESI